MVEPPVSDHPECKDLIVVADGSWLLGRGLSTFAFLEDNLLHTISKLCHV